MRLIKSRRMRWMKEVASTGEIINVYEILVRKPEGKRPLGRLRHKWEDTIKMDLKTGCEGVE
jgi:hypothetical protein